MPIVDICPLRVYCSFAFSNFPSKPRKTKCNPTIAEDKVNHSSLVALTYGSLRKEGVHLMCIFTRQIVSVVYLSQLYYSLSSLGSSAFPTETWGDTGNKTYVLVSLIRSGTYNSWRVLARRRLWKSDESCFRSVRWLAMCRNKRCASWFSSFNEMIMLGPRH